jgi:hypothetical protein
MKVKNKKDNAGRKLGILKIIDKSVRKSKSTTSLVLFISRFTFKKN